MVNLQTAATVIFTVLLFKSTLTQGNNGLEISHEKERSQTFVHENRTNGLVLRRSVREVKKTFEDHEFVYDLRPGEYAILSDIWKLIPSSHDRIKVVNIGNYTVLGTSLWDGLIGSWKPIESASIIPGLTMYYSKFDRVVESGIKIENKENGRALFYTSRMSEHESSFSHKKPPSVTPPLEFQRHAVKTLLQFATTISGRLEDNDFHEMFHAMVTTYWTSNLTVVEKMANQLKPFLTNKVFLEIQYRLKAHFTPVTDATKKIMELMDNNYCLSTGEYRDVIDSVQNLHEQAIFSPYFSDYEDVNYYVLPLYSHFVNIMNTVYLFGIYYQDHLGLSDGEATHIKLKMQRLAKSASLYIENMSTERLEHAYNTAEANYIYDELMNVRTYMSVHGFAYIPFWNYATDPINNKINYTSLAYSEYFGRATIDLYMNTLHKLNRLQPSVISLSEDYSPIGSIRKKMQSLRVYLGWDNYDTIVNIVTAYEDLPADYRITAHTVVVDLTGRTIKKLEAGGDGMLDYLVLTLSDGEYIQIGKNIRKNNKVMELKHHHIAAIFAGNDCRDVSATQICNIAVSYALDEVEYM